MLSFNENVKSWELMCMSNYREDSGDERHSILLYA
jgi:hypothetical protein